MRNRWPKCELAFFVVVNLKFFQSMLLLADFALCQNHGEAKRHRDFHKQATRG
jgi:hypothetical protein